MEKEALSHARRKIVETNPVGKDSLLFGLDDTMVPLNKFMCTCGSERVGLCRREVECEVARNCVIGQGRGLFVAIICITIQPRGGSARYIERV